MADGGGQQVGNEVARRIEEIEAEALKKRSVVALVEKAAKAGSRRLPDSGRRWGSTSKFDTHDLPEDTQRGLPNREIVVQERAFGGAARVALSW